MRQGRESCARRSGALELLAIDEQANAFELRRLVLEIWAEAAELFRVTCTDVVVRRLVDDVIAELHAECTARDILHAHRLGREVDQVDSVLHRDLEVTPETVQTVEL